MTDDELNEIFRAIRHRRTLSWATIEKMANEIRQTRKPPAKPATYNYWNHFSDVVPTTMFPPKPDQVPDKLTVKAVNEIARQMRQDDLYGAYMKHPDVVAESRRVVKMIRDRTVFNSLMPLPIADSQKKE